jgi:hypothetical protein
LTNGNKKTYLFGVTHEMNPNLQVNEKRIIIWDAQTKRITKDDCWQYKIKPGVGVYEHASIVRVTGDNLRESWHYDAARGEDKKEFSDGSKESTKWFTTGKLAGKIRYKIHSRAKSNASFAQHFFYDEEARLIRIVDQLANKKTFYDRTLPFGYTQVNVKDATSNQILECRLLDMQGKTIFVYPPSYNVIIENQNLAKIVNTDGKLLYSHTTINK